YGNISTAASPGVFPCRGTIPSRLRIAAHALPVYASRPALPMTTQHSVPGAWPGLLGSGPTPDGQSRALLGALVIANEQQFIGHSWPCAFATTAGFAPACAGRDPFCIRLFLDGLRVVPKG